MLIHFSDISFQIAKNKYFGIRKSILIKYLKPVFFNFAESVAENIKLKMAKTILETFNELNYSSGLSRRVSIRLGKAASGYNINF
jgi:F0F1-type ATP synthase delta subunit